MRLTMLAATAMLLIVLVRTTPVLLGQHLEVVADFPRQPELVANYVYPRWHAGHMVWWSRDFPPRIKVLDEAGALVVEGTIAFPSAPYVRITNVAVSSSGRVAFSFLGRDDQGRGTPAIGWMSSSGDVEFVARTDDFATNYLSFSPDGSLWALGRNNLVDVLAHFDSSGVIVRRLEFSREAGANFIEPRPRALFVVEDRIGIIMDGKSLWTELAPNGNILGQWPVPSDVNITGMALTPAADVYLATAVPPVSGRDAEIRLLRLDREQGQWGEVEYQHLVEPGYPGLELHGAHGESVVVRTSSDPTKYLIARVVD